jgi:hypothetical protein
MERFMESWSDPHIRHAILVHIPITLGLVGVLPLAWLAIDRFRSPTLKQVVVAWFLVAALGAKAAAMAGEEAADHLREAGAMSEADASAVAVHEGRGGIAWVWPLIPAGLTALTFTPRRGVRMAAGALAVAGACGVTGWYGVIAHAGGGLVYAHGLGVPQRVTEVDAEPPSPAGAPVGRDW